jgi:glycosyltransferase involved in cell wall biosynthesis
MQNVAYLANVFPAEVEWYVGDEIRTLRARGARVLPCSVRGRGNAGLADMELGHDTLYFLPLRWKAVLRAIWLLVLRAPVLWRFVRRILAGGGEPLGRRVRALAHTAIGVYFAGVLYDEGIDHIHVHHGYYASWVAMVAAQMLGIPFSLTLHGSDLLVAANYLDTKLANCAFCITISEFNRLYILAHFLAISPAKVMVLRLGVEVPRVMVTPVHEKDDTSSYTLLSVGRLHAVKNHLFLIQACFFLKESGVRFECRIVGEGPERRRLEFLIEELGLSGIVHLQGALPRAEVERFYDAADLVLLTSSSEGIPLVLMEAMARGKVVLAPAITGIPELVSEGKTGFLYPPGEMQEFVWRVDQILRTLPALSEMRHAARERVRNEFERSRNLDKFADEFLERVRPAVPASEYAHPVLQQI